MASKKFILTIEIGGIRMMKKSVILVIFLICSFSIFAQTAYRDLTWGMSLDEVRSIYSDVEFLPDWLYSSNMISFMDFRALGMFLNCTQDNYIIIPSDFPKRENIYWSPKECIKFYFEEGKLRFVAINRCDELSISDLISKYGKPYRQTWNIVFNSYPTMEIQEIFINEKNRFVMVVRREWDGNGGRYNVIDELLYLDRKWFSNYFVDYFNNYKIEHASTTESLLG
jgi:hypothetical protein